MLDELVVEVLARNPTLQAAVAAWQAAAQRYPQVVSLDDPMFEFMLGPQGLGPDGGWMVMARQKLPWSAKRYWRGEVARAEANAACWKTDEIEQRLREATKLAFFDYYLACRQLEVNKDIMRLVSDFRAIAKTKYEAGRAPEQDMLQAEVELGELEAQKLELDRDVRIAAARINTLLHRPPDSAIPPPPDSLDEFAPSPLPLLQDLAQQQRPELAVVRAQIYAEQASKNLACKEYFPDVEIAARYDAFMPEDMRPQVGMNINVPLQRDRRHAAVHEAAARLRQRRAEYDQLVDSVQSEVHEAYERVHEKRQVVQLFEEKILPAAEESLRSAESSYSAGNLDFLRLLDAERQLHNQRRTFLDTVADYHRRVAELERAVGGPLETSQ